MSGDKTFHNHNDMTLMY